MKSGLGNKWVPHCAEWTDKKDGEIMQKVCEIKQQEVEVEPGVLVLGVNVSCYLPFYGM